MENDDIKLRDKLIASIVKFSEDQYGYIKSYEKENDTVYYKCDFNDALLTLWLKHAGVKPIIRYITQLETVKLP